MTIGRAPPVLARCKGITGSQGVSVAGIAEPHSTALQLPRPLGQTRQLG